MSTNPTRHLVDVLTDEVGECSSSADEHRSSYERSRMAITSVQLLHVDRILRAHDSRSPDEFLAVLDERTPILGFFKWRWDTHGRAAGGPIAAFDSARDCFLERLRAALADMYVDDTGPDRHARMTSYLQARHEELDAIFGTYEQQYQGTTHEWTRVGAIQVAPARPLEVLLARYPLLIDGLAGHGLGPDTPAIQVHVPTRFTQGESPWEPGRTILQLARHLRIIERSYAARGVRALFGLSWQFDSVLGRRLGFTVVDTPDLPQNIMGAWYQLVNEDGSFNKKRLAHFEKYNALPYRLKCGFRRLS